MIARFYQPTLSTSEALGESWDPNHVHFLITVEEPVEDTGPVVFEEEAYVFELPLHAMHHRES